MTFLRNIDHSTIIQQICNKLDCNVACFIVISDEKSMQTKTANKGL